MSFRSSSVPNLELCLANGVTVHPDLDPESLSREPLPDTLTLRAGRPTQRASR